MADSSPSARHALNGSCHCGAVRYIVFLTLPHPHPGGQAAPPGSQRFYRCNCTICHKAGFFHVRVASNVDDFLLLSPLDPLSDLGDYLWRDQRLHFLYCKTCATRCFSFGGGDSEVVDVDLAAMGVAGHAAAEAGEKTKVWRVKNTGQHPEKANYLSVNGHTIDAGQAFGMRELTDEKVVQYYDYLHDEAAGRYDKPHPGGCY